MYRLNCKWKHFVLNDAVSINTNIQHFFKILLGLTGQDLHLTARQLRFQLSRPASCVLVAEGHISMLRPGPLQSDTIRIQSLHIVQSWWACFRAHHVNIKPSVLSEAGAEMEADIVVVEWWATLGTKSSSILVNQALNALCCCGLDWSVIWNRAITYISGSPFVWLIGQELSQFSVLVPAKCDRGGMKVSH